MPDLKAQLEISADASGVESGVAGAKRSLASLGASAAAAGQEASKGLAGAGAGGDQAAKRIDAATKSIIGSIQRTTAALDAGGRSSSKYFETLASQRGVDVGALKPYLAQLDSVNAKQGIAGQAVAAGSAALNQYGQSARQTAAALRQVPAQLTDIITSLQGGQAPLTVLLQQGGQLRDVFGGIAPAARALGGAVLGLINPFTIAAAIVGSLALAYKQGSGEADEFAKSIVLSGNAAGTTVGQLQEMARSIGAVTGSQAAAAEALALFARSGSVANENLQRFSASAVRFEKVTGQAVSETVKQFEALAKEPVAASIKLNETTRFLTTSLYQQINALEEQGRTVDAATVAQRALADFQESSSNKLEDQLGTIQRSWDAVAKAAKLAWNAMLNIGRPDSNEDRLASLQSQLAALTSAPNVGPEFGGTSDATRADEEASLRTRIEGLKAVLAGELSIAAAAKDGNAQVEARIAFDKEGEQFLNKRVKLERELAKARQQGIAAGASQAEIDKRLADIREKFRDKSPAARAPRDDEATRLLQRLREGEAATRAQLLTTEKLTASEKQRAEFVQQLADLKEKRVLTADQKSLLLNADAIKAQLDRNIAAEKEVDIRAATTRELEKQRKELDAFKDRAAQLSQTIAGSNEARREQVDDRLRSFGRGADAREQLDAQIGIQREFRRYQEQLDKATPKDLLGSELYKQESASIKASLAEALGENRRYFERLKALQGDFSLGASEAFANYIDDARKAGLQAQEIFSNAFQGLEDELTDFVSTGKGSFKELGDSIARDVSRASVRQSLGQLFGAAGGALSKQGGALGEIGKVIGGVAGGAGDAAATLTQTTAITGAIGLSTTAITAAIYATAGASGLGSAGSGIADALTSSTGSSTSFASFFGNTFGGSAGAASGGSSFASFFGSLFGGFFADGGNPPLGKVSVVGERGPELFVPRSPGTIVPLAKASRGSAEQRPPTVVHNHFAISGPVDRRTQQQIAGAAARSVAAANLRVG